MEQKKRSLLILVIDSNHKQGSEINWQQTFEKAKLRRFSVQAKETEVGGLKVGESLTAKDFYNDNSLEDEVFFSLFDQFDVSVDQANWNDLELTSYHDSALGKRACFSIQASSKPIIEAQVSYCDCHN